MRKEEGTMKKEKGLRGLTTFPGDGKKKKKKNGSNERTCSPTNSQWGGLVMS